MPLPNVELLFYLTCHWPKCELVTKWIFPSKIIFCNLIEFLMTKTTQNSISPHLRFRNFQITSLKSYLMRLFQQYSAYPNSPIICGFDLSEFLLKICSIINKLFAIIKTLMKPTWCTCTHQECSNIIKHSARGTGSTHCDKQNKQTAFFGR